MNLETTDQNILTFYQNKGHEMSFTFCFQFFKVESSWSHGFLSKYMLKMLRSTCSNHIEARKGACFLFVLSNYHAKEIMFLSHWKPINSRLWRKSLHKLPYYFKRIREHVQENHLNNPEPSFHLIHSVKYKMCCSRFSWLSILQWS